MNDTLDAWLQGRRIGVVRREDERGILYYDPSYVAIADAFPLSPPLGFRAKVGEEQWAGRCRRFFENLLPEGRAFEDVLSAHTLSRANVFGLLRVLGRETTGALTLLPPGTSPSDTGDRREVSFEELSLRIRSRAEVSFTLWDQRVRLSIAGAQDKLGVYIEDGRLFLVDGGLATTHILKPDHVGLPHLVVTEAACMRLARQCGIEAAEATVLRVPEPVLSVRRFDRVLRGGRVVRRHVVDGCQALDLPAAYKYERNFGSGRDVVHVRDGVSFPRLIGLADRCLRPAETRRALLRRVVFDVMVGNADAHGKNVSFFLGSSGMSLAPVYDIVCVAAWPHLSQELAMAIGDQFDGAKVRRSDWEKLAEDCVVPGRLVLREVAAMAKRVRAAVDTIVDVAVNEAERGHLERVRAIILERCEQATG